MNPAPLSSFYYVENFTTALRALQRRDHDLLSPQEARFIADFFGLPPGAQALMVRMALRRGPFYRGRSLEYPEVPAPGEQLELLKSRGFITDDPVIDFQGLIDALPGTWLAEGFGLRASPVPSKERMRWQALEMYPQPLPLSATHFRLQDGLYEFLHAGLCGQLCAMYFGNCEQHWSEYVVAELGVRRYERIRIDAASRPFASRAEVDAFRALGHCEAQLDSGKAVEMLAHLPAVPSACDWLHEWHQRIGLKLARQLEREGEVPAALLLYRQLGSPEAEERQRILTRRARGDSAAAQFNHRSVPHFDLALPAGANSRIEYSVARHLLAGDPDSEVLYAENRLLNSLFGLLLWPALFLPVRGAFFHAFHAAPADLHSPQFRARRSRAIDACLGELDSGAYRETIRRNFEAKAGLLNPFVLWRWLRRPVLELALGSIPAAHLRSLFEWMLSDLKRNTAGFPDLIQFWPGSGRYRMIEVKLGADRLQGNQRRFLRCAIAAGIPVSVCYVTQGASRRGRVRVGRAVRRSGETLDLFPESAASSAV